MFELLGFFFFLVAAVLIWKRGDVPASQRAKWSAMAFLGLLLPPLLLAVLQVTLPQSSMRLILVPFAVVAEMVVPWIALAVFKDRFPKPEATEPT